MDDNYWASTQIEHRKAAARYQDGYLRESWLGGPGTSAELDAARRTRWRHFSAMTKLLVQSGHGDS